MVFSFQLYLLQQNKYTRKERKNTNTYFACREPWMDWDLSLILWIVFRFMIFFWWLLTKNKKCMKIAISKICLTNILYNFTSLNYCKCQFAVVPPSSTVLVLSDSWVVRESCPPPLMSLIPKHSDTSTQVSTSVCILG